MSSPPNTPSDDAAHCGCLRFPIFTKGRHTAKKLPSIRQNTSSSTAFQLRPVTEAVRDAQIMEVGIETIMPIIPEAPTKYGNEDAKNTETIRDGSGAISPTRHGNGDAQSSEARNGSDAVVSIQALPSRASTIIPAVPSTNHEDGDPPSKEAGGDADPILAITTEVSTASTAREKGRDGDQESSMINRRSGNVQGEVVGGVDRPIPILTIAKEPPSVTTLQGASNIQINHSNITTIGGNATIIRFGDGEFTDVQRDLIGDYIAKHIVLPAINDDSKKHVLTQLIINLPRAEAVFDDYQTKKKSGPCFGGTRVALLKEMADWMTSQDESRMYILSGLAGIGKSTVAYTIASRAADFNLLGASFFFSRDEADRNNAKKLFTTIAYQLCVYDEQFSKTIGDALLTEHGSAAVTKGPQEQLRAPVLDPLRRIVQSRVRPILVIVDALDECCEADVRGVIQGLGQLVRNLSSFKVILTARPHPYIDYFLNNQGRHRLFRLQEIEDKIVDHDIRLYLKYSLSLEKVREHYPRQKWYASDEQIDLLVRAAGRLFIVAATSVRYILDKSVSNPAAQMKKLLRARSQDYTPFKDISCFYTLILRNAVSENCDDETIIRYQLVVGAIIFIRRPLPVSALGYLIQTDVEDIYAVLDNLRSVILLGEDDIPRIYHKSFPDFVTDQAHCKDPYLKIDPMACHTQLSKHCFEIMNKHLKYNILGLGTPARFMNNEDGLKKDGITKEQLEEKIPQQLRYVCVYWVAHLEFANIEDSGIMDGLDKFVNEHMLHWFEVLSIIGKLDSAHHAIRVVLNLLKQMSSGLDQLLSDALRFISKFYEIIDRSALHTYYSAFPFSPTKSLLHYRYIKGAEHRICDVEGGMQKWDALLADLNHGEWVNVVKFSANSAMLISYSEKYVSPYEAISKIGKLKTWDAVTGILVSTIPGDRFAISNDFSTIASSKDNIITYYDPEGTTTGNAVMTSSEIKILALSCESNRVAAGLSDGTVCLWEGGHGKLIGSFDGYAGSEVLRFSPSGIWLVYSLENGTVTVRDGINGRFITDLQCGLQNKLEFSADGSRFASLSKDCGLKLWNGEISSLIDAVTDAGDRALAISANGSLLATANRRYSVMLWSENCGQLTKIKTLVEYARSIAFSPDDRLAICGGPSVKTRIYNIEADTASALPAYGLYAPLAFSPDGTRLACGTLLYDAQAISTSSPPGLSRRSPLTTIILSPDCSRLSCSFENGIVELWETSLMMRRISSHQVSRFRIKGMDFGPDSRLFASWSWHSCIIGVWNGGDGSLLGTLNVSTESVTVALSNRMLIAGGDREVTLWDLDTLSLLHTFTVGQIARRASISDQGDLAAIVFQDGSVHLFDLENRTTTYILTHDFQDYDVHLLTFLPDKSHLVAQSYGGNFQSINLVNKHIASGPMLEHLIRLPNTPLWHGVPIWLSWVNRQPCVVGLFSQDQGPVPVLWIPSDISVQRWSQESSMIASSDVYGRVILLRLRT